MLRRYLYNRKVKRLARVALLRAAELYRSGAFEWVTGKELIDGETFTTARRIDRIPAPEAHRSADAVMLRRKEEDDDGYGFGFDIYDEIGLAIEPETVYNAATGGCLLGGVGKAAFEVAGKPTYGTDAWQLKNDVEDEADWLLTLAIARRRGEDAGDREAEIKLAADGGGAIPSFNDGSVYGTEGVIEILEEAAHNGAFTRLNQ